jgi:hypothetical protein
MRGILEHILRLGACCGLCACYAPSYSDCQFTCTTQSPCPDGLACLDGHCRTAELAVDRCLVVAGPDAAAGEADAHGEAPAHDASTCQIDETSPVLACGGSVLCVEKLEADTIQARLVFAKDVRVDELDAPCVIESGAENAWEQANGGVDLTQTTVTVDVIYAREIRAKRLEAGEIRAKSVEAAP